MNHKRFLLLLLVLALVLVAPIHTFADPPDDQCPSPFSSDGHHSYSQSRQEATCTDAGSITWVCADCNKEYTETIPALGHSFGAPQTRQAATCTAGGTNVYTCTRCGAEEVRNIDPLGHGWDNGVVTQAPTCADEGVRTFTCLRCGATRTEAIAKTADHTPVTVPGRAATCTEAGLTDGSKCSICGAVLMAQQSIPAKGHSWDGGRVTQEATCTAEGVKTFTCYNCGATRTDTFPAKGHTPTTVAGKAATCNEAGLTEGSQCSACGAILKAQETIPAKGHAWDQGVITTEPQGFTPGVRTFTCTVCGATKTEAVDSTLSVFSGMNIPSGFGFLLSNDPVPENLLHIVQQPEDGYIPHAELTVEAAGGEGEYTYEWWYAPELPTVGTSALTDFLTGMYGDTVAAVSQAKEKTAPIAAQMLEAWKMTNAITVTKAQPAASTETLYLEAESFNPFATRLSEDSPSINAWERGTYWVVVYDEAGHHATSDKVQVQYGLYISGQPESKNIYGLSSVTLSCRARGGSGNYAYTWYDGNGNVVEDQQTYVAEQMGVYYCEVADYDTLEVVQSKPAQVYSEERDIRPVITFQPKSVIVEYREDGQYDVSSFTCKAISPLTGDDSNLEYVWEVWNDQGDGWGNTDVTDEELHFYDVQPNTLYHCRVTDKTNGAFVISDEVKVATKMKIWVWHDAPDYNNVVLLYYRIEGGKAPYTVQIMQEFKVGNEFHDVLMRKYTKNDNETHFQAVSADYQPLTYDNEGYLEHYTNIYATYHLEVVDAVGQYRKSISIMISGKEAEPRS
ncbi:MAG: hypothetical protein IKE11_01870 [Clostridia bacterium]|nr:hypothetical protein [Clostridia bacterium]